MYCKLGHDLLLQHIHQANEKLFEPNRPTRWFIVGIKLNYNVIVADQGFTSSRAFDYSKHFLLQYPFHIEALMYYDLGQTVLGLISLLCGATIGEPQSLSLLGFVFQQGIGVDIDNELSLVLHMKSGLNSSSMAESLFINGQLEYAYHSLLRLTHAQNNEIVQHAVEKYKDFKAGESLLLLSQQ